MADKEKSGNIAPGYPVITALEDMDVSGWEPAAIFRPVNLTDAEDAAGDGV